MLLCLLFSVNGQPHKPFPPGITMYRPEKEGFIIVFAAGQRPKAALALFLMAVLLGTLPGKLPRVIEGIVNRLAPCAAAARVLGEPRELLVESLPVLKWVGPGGEETAALYPFGHRLFYDAKLALEGLVGVGLAHPAAALKSQLFPQVAGTAGVSEHRAGMGFPLENISFAEKKPVSPVLRAGGCVLIYCTHTGETYALTDGVNRLEGRPGGVVTAAAALKEALLEQGVAAFFSGRVHDADYGDAYLESEKTAAGMLAAYPDALAVLDVHRDFGKTREQSAITVGGIKAAPVLLVVGAGGRPNGAWRSNYEFARRLAQKMDQLYPGLCAGVRLKDGRYNQHLHPRALLVEIGTTQNSVGEAAAAAEMLAYALVQTLAEGE